MIPGLIKEDKQGYTYTIDGQFSRDDFGVYPVHPLTLGMKLKLLFRKTHKLTEVIRTVKEDSSEISYNRYSTYKMYKGTRIYLSSYISCYIQFKFEEDVKDGGMENNTN